MPDESPNDRNPTDGGDSPSQPGREKRRIGQVVREAALISAPTILIVYPLVGFGLGYLTVKLWNWPLWVPLITLIMGFVQGIREVMRLGRKIEEKPGDRGD